MWKGDISNLDHVAIEALKNRILIKPMCCENARVHIYGHKRNTGFSSAWVWCSSCGAYSHLDGIPINETWENDSNVDMSQVTAVPIYLESIADAIDEHFDRFMGI